MSELSQRANYYRCAACTGALLAQVRSDTIFSATIHVVPAASSAVALAGAINFFLLRRRSASAHAPGVR